MTRRKTTQIAVGKVKIGSNSPISVQSMTNTDTADVKATVKQIKALEKAGCELVRAAVPNMEAAEAVGKIKKSIDIPLIADIHFDYRLALKVIDKGIDGLRLNPGNIGNKERIETVVKAAKDKKIPIRIGVNAGSLEKDILERYSHPITEAGTIFSGTVKSAAGLGILLSEGIGDTLRVSLTGDPIEEVRVGWEILKA